MNLWKELLPAVLLVAPAAARAENPLSEALPADTSRVQDVEAAVVVAQPKEHALLRRQAVSASVFGGRELAARGVEAVKDISAFAPNLYMPDYGSRLTSAVYVRGVGSRSGSPAVGLYVDGVPFADKSAYDFDFLDVARVDVLRGPQGTLYGRGAMGGVLRVFTADPLTTHGTTVRLGATTRETGRHAAVSTFLHPSETFGLSLGAFAKGAEGFRHNTTTGRHADGSDVAGGHLRAAWKPSTRFRIDYTAAYQYSDEESNPYVYEGPAEGDDDAYPELRGQISQNRQSHYRRSLFTTGLTTTYTAPRVTLTSITAYQWLRDRLYMDQDYLRTDLFSLEQRQRMQSISEELSLKGGRGRWVWTWGAFFQYDHKHTRVPVDFYADGVAYLNTLFADVLPGFVGLSFTDNRLPFRATLRATGTNAAAFHESTLKDLFTPGLSLTLGLRLDYDRHALRLNSPATAYPYTFTLRMPAFGLNLAEPLSADAAFGGHNSRSDWQLLPKVALQYDFGRTGTAYFTVSRGYRPGGYNLENYSDLSQSLLRRNIMAQVRDYSAAAIGSLPLPEAAKQAALGGMTGTLEALMPQAPDVADLAYEPEYTWSHELGTHLTLLDGALQVDAAAFVLATHNLQISQFAPSGMGRVVVNAGKSRTWGCEAQVRAALLANRLSLTASYGLARSIFTRYSLGKDADYSGNHVPYAPTHTAALAADFRQPLSHGFVRAVRLSASLVGAGKIFWDEANTFSQPFSAQLAARLGVELPHVDVTLWAKNLTCASYKTFAFDTMGRRFAQYGDPFHLGLDVALRF